MASRQPVGGNRGHPDPYFVATTKLSQDWSANRCVSHVNDAWLDSLLDDERFFSMDPIVKVRLLLAGMVALNQPALQSNEGAREQLRGSLARLQQAAATDADEWVKVMAAAAGQLDGRLQLEAVMQQSAVVHETITALKQQVQESSNQHLFPPLEDVYLIRNPTVLNPDSGHFQLRQNPRVQPLGTSMGSYSNATPPPPSLLASQQGEQHSTTFLRPQHKLSKQIALAQTSSGQAADGGGGSSGATGLARKASGMAPRGPRVQVLGRDEQQEMQDVLQKSLKAKGHGVAAHVRHEVRERPVGQKPRTSEAGQQQHDNEEGGAGDVVMLEMEHEHDDDDDDDDEGLLHTAVAPGSRERESRRQNQQRRPGGGRRSGYGGRSGGDRGASAGASAAAAAAAAREAAIEEEIDELFEDSPADEEDLGRAPAATGVSRSVKGLQHHRGEMEDEQAPAELQDYMDDDMMEGVEQEEITAGPAAAGGGAGREGAGQWEGAGSRQEGETAAVAAKRRRVIVDDDEEDDD